MTTYTAKQLYDLDIAEFHLRFPDEDTFATWEESLIRYPGTVKFFRDQSVYLNHLAGTPEEDDFGPVEIPHVRRTAVEQYWHLTHHAHRIALPSLDEAKVAERFVLERMYERIADLTKPFRALLLHDGTGELFECFDRAECDKLLSCANGEIVDDVTGNVQHEASFKAESDDGLGFDDNLNDGLDL